MKVAKPLTFPDFFHQHISLQKLNPSPTETPSNTFVITVKDDSSYPAPKQIHHKEVQHPLLTPNSKHPSIHNGLALKIQTTNKTFPKRALIKKDWNFHHIWLTFARILSSCNNRQVLEGNSLLQSPNVLAQNSYKYYRLWGRISLET